MPINEPIKNRKVAPASLAFEGLTRGSGAGVYQVGTDITQTTTQEIVNNYFYSYTFQYLTQQFVEVNNDRLMRAIQNSEQRSKHWVGEYKRSLQWDLKRDQVYYTNQYTPIAYNNEVLRTNGARSFGNPALGTAGWQFETPSDSNGVWFMYAHLSIRHTNTDLIIEGRLAFFINNVMFRIIDLVDNSMMGHTHILDMRLQGGCHVPLRSGDVFEVRYLPVSGPNIVNTAIYPSSVYSYVTGHRENCDDYIPINPPYTGQQYIFNHEV